MKRLLVLCSIALFFIVFLGGVGFAQSVTQNIPTKTISYQGIITTENGTSLTATIPVTVVMYKDENGTDKVWEGTYLTKIDRGVFQIQLGSGEYPLPVVSELDRGLWIGVRLGESSEMRPLTPLSASPYALNVADKAITIEKLGPDVISMMLADKSDQTPQSDPNDWTITGNAGTTAGTNFVGTMDSVALELHVFDGDATANQGSKRVVRYEPNGTSANVITGYQSNAVATGVFGATISGGGRNANIQNVYDDFGTIGGGDENIAGDNTGGTTTDDPYATVSGGEQNTASGSHAAVGGGFSNIASGDQATVAGGDDNEASGIESTIGGGINNLSSGLQSAITGGDNNTASGTESAIGGGRDNTASAVQSAVLGGDANIAQAIGATVGGGLSNDASAEQSAIIGGDNNTASGLESVIGGGKDNTAVNDQAAVLGGETNSASGIESTVGGGFSNLASGEQSAVLGGDDNTASGTESFVGGGRGNIAPSLATTLGGGVTNNAGGQFSTVGGGTMNTNFFFAPLPPTMLFSEYAFVGGGLSNTITDHYGTIGGGRDNWAGNDRNNLPAIGFPPPPLAPMATDAQYAAVLGGYYNSALEWESTVGGGEDNVAGAIRAGVFSGFQGLAYGSASFIGGGEDNQIQIAILPRGSFAPYAPLSSRFSAIAGGFQGLITMSDFGFIGSGYNNTITGGSNNGVIGGGSLNTLTAAANSVIGGGSGNSVSSSESVIGGGSGNSITSNASGILGGTSNSISASNSAIGGGQSNSVSSTNSVVGGGTTNVVSGTQSVISGGSNNSIVGTSSAIAGGQFLRLNDRSFGFNGDVNTNLTDLTSNPFDNVALFNEVDLWVGNVNGTARQLRLYEPNGTHTYIGTNFTSFASGAQSANINYTVPLTIGTTGSMLFSSNTTGTALQMAWLAPGSGGQFLTMSGGLPTWTSTLTASAFVGTGSTTNAVDLGTAEVAGTLPITRGGTNTTTIGGNNSIAFSNGTALQYTSVAPINNQILSFNGTSPVWVNATSVGDWTLSGNAPASAWNGTTGSFLGTTNTVALVLATTNTSTAQPIEFHTNNTRRMTVNGANGFLGIATAAPEAELDLNGCLAIRASAQQTATNGNPLTIGNTSFIRVTSTGTPVNRVVTVPNGPTNASAILIIKSVCTGTSGFRIVMNGASNWLGGDGNNRRDFTLDDVLVAIWDPNVTKWVEINFDNN